MSSDAKQLANEVQALRHVLAADTETNAAVASAVERLAEAVERLVEEQRRFSGDNEYKLGATGNVDETGSWFWFNGGVDR